MPFFHMIREYLTGSLRNWTGILNDLNELIEGVCPKIHTKPMIAFIACIVLTVIVGIIGYRIMRVLVGVAAGVGGYFAGVALFEFITAKWLHGLPGWAGYVCGGVLAAFFLVLAFAKHHFAWFALAGVSAFAVLSAVLQGASTMVFVAGAFLVAMLCACLPRPTFILFTAFLAGLLSVNFASAVLPKVAVLQFGTEKTALLIALGVGALMAVIQFLICAPRYTIEEEW